ncbi:MAG: FtsX-like permease family protein [Gammaproteobacteria bacterium]|nr:FtsX-like permease family protein [Gammaproteobacteria bacterium]
MTSPLRMAWRLLRREWRSGELRVLALALLIAVAAVTSVSFFTDRVERALSQQANDLLGADLLLSAGNEFAPAYVQQAAKLNLQTSASISFPSMVMTDQASHLGMIKAIDDHFPLRGHVRVADKLFAPDYELDRVPHAGEIWMEGQIMSALGLQVGDRVALGMREFTVGAVLTTEPGVGGMFTLAPRILFNMSDLAATELVQPASRVKHYLQVAGERSAVAEFRAWVAQRNDVGVAAQGVEDARPEMRQALDRSRQFLGLAALTSVLLAGVAIALAARRFAQRHLDHCAILRCLGAVQGYVLKIYLWQLVLLGLIASLLGCALGFVAHLLLVDLLGGLLDIALPAASWTLLWVAMVTGVMTLLGFALPPLLQLQSVPALRVLRRDLGQLGAPGWISYSLGLLVLAGLMVYQAGELRMGLLLVAGTLVALLVLWLVAQLLVALLGPLRARTGGAWRFGLVNIVRRRQASVVQVVAFGLGLMALLLLAVIRGDLLAQWQNSIPDGAPNRFIINLQPEQVPAMRIFFAENGRDAPLLWPMVRGRLVAIGDKPVVAQSYADDRARQLATREFNLSWTDTLPKANKLLAGHWWSGQGHEFSVESGVAKALGIQLGDELHFEVAGQRFSARVSSLREVSWDSFEPNFFVLGSPGSMDGLPATYMTALYLGSEDYTLLNQMLQAFSNVSVIDVAAIMTHVRNVITRVSNAVEYVFGFTLLAGLMVLYAGIQSTHDERLQESAIVRTLGGQKKQVLQALLMEFVLLGVLAGTLAAALASALAWGLATWVLKIDYHFNALVWLLGVGGGALAVGLAGVLGSYQVVRQPPLTTLRKLSL